MFHKHFLTILFKFALPSEGGGLCVWNVLLFLWAVTVSVSDRSDVSGIFSVLLLTSFNLILSLLPPRKSPRWYLATSTHHNWLSVRSVLQCPVQLKSGFTSSCWGENTLMPTNSTCSHQPHFLRKPAEEPRERSSPCSELRWCKGRWAARMLGKPSTGPTDSAVKL